jgi:hypothetical protein
MQLIAAMQQQHAIQDAVRDAQVDYKTTGTPIQN